MSTFRVHQVDKNHRKKCEEKKIISLFAFSLYKLIFFWYNKVLSLSLPTVRRFVFVYPRTLPRSASRWPCTYVKRKVYRNPNRRIMKWMNKTSKIGQCFIFLTLSEWRRSSTHFIFPPRYLYGHVFRVSANTTFSYKQTRGHRLFGSQPLKLLPRRHHFDPRE